MNYTFSPETQKKLLDLGVEPQYRTRVRENIYKVGLIDVFDLLIPENAKKVWGEELECEDCGKSEIKPEFINAGYCGGCETCGKTEEEEIDICGDCLRPDTVKPAYKIEMNTLADLFSSGASEQEIENYVLESLKIS